LINNLTVRLILIVAAKLTSRSFKLASVTSAAPLHIFLITNLLEINCTIKMAAPHNHPISTAFIQADGNPEALRLTLAVSAGVLSFCFWLLQVFCPSEYRLFWSDFNECDQEGDVRLIWDDSPRPSAASRDSWGMEAN